LTAFGWVVAGGVPAVRDEPSLDSAPNQDGAPKDTAKAVIAKPLGALATPFRMLTG